MQFANNPILEAILNIQIEDVPFEAITAFEKALEPLQSEYPHKNPLNRFRFENQISQAGPQALAEQTPVGLQYRSADDKRVFQIRTDGFTFNRLAPYSDWHEFMGHARKIWDLYSSAVVAVKSQSFSVRYINKLDIPMNGDLRDYLRIFPEILEGVGLPQVITNLHMRLELPLEDGGILHLQEARVQSNSDETASILLDNEFMYGALGFSQQVLWSEIEKVREMKNKIFVGCLTPEMQRRIS